jgi:hypothetical protein
VVVPVCTVVVFAFLPLPDPPISLETLYSLLFEKNKKIEREGSALKRMTRHWIIPHTFIYGGGYFDFWLMDLSFLTSGHPLDTLLRTHCWKYAGRAGLGAKKRKK